MICDTCRHDNQPNAKFCSECGTALARRCPSCGNEQSPTAKFCDECGTPLAAAPPPASTAASSPSAARKRVTALFADLVGSTSFAERVDPEAVRSSLAPYFDMLQSTIDDHAGSVVKFLGDGMLALFGVPEVAEDDALRAVAAGVDLQRRFRSFADEIRERHGVELDLRVGVNTGELVIGADDADLVGDVLNTAARLEAACEPGRVLVGENTWRLTRSNVAFEVLDEVRVKGKADTVATFQVVENDDGAVGPGDDNTVFVGRSDELDLLGGVFADAVATSSARLATVIGSPGVGKTRLARELCARTETRSFDLRLERRGATTFTPIADLLRSATGSASIEAIDGFLQDHPEQDRLAPVLASFLGHGDARTTEESFWAVRRLLELLAADGPVIVVVDDIQWAEPLFWDLLDHLVEWTAAPVVLLALARPELRDLRPELTQPGRRVAASIALEGLDADTTLELAARLLGIDELPVELADRLPESTEGNPLFVRELVQMLVDDGVLARDGDRWRLTIDADAIEVPPTILSLLASRVERLPDDERQVVELASVIGTEFDRGTLEAIADADDVGRLGVVIDRLRRKDLIEPSGQWSGDHPVYRFHHVLIRDAAYRRLLKAHRAELHELVGRHAESAGVADDEIDIIVAHHFEQVFRYRSELGALDDHTRALATTAATRLRSAAELALEREDLSSAGNAAIRALQLLDVDAGADRDELLLIGCEALLATGDATKASPLVDELHGRSSDERLAAWADCFRGQMWSLTDAERLTEAAEVTADAAERLAAIGDNSGVAKARLVRASCLARLGRVGDCEAELDLALGAARAAGDRRRTVAVLGAAPLAALWGPSPVARAGGRCLDVLRLLRITSASPTVEATSIRCQGMLEALRGRFDSARSKLETSRATARELGLRHGLYETELFAGMVELFADDAAAAEPHLRAARDGLGRLGIGADAGQASALLARSLLLQGRIAEADQLAADALDTAGQNLQTAITAGAVLAEVRAAQGRHDDARRLVDDAISIASPTDVTLDHALTVLAAARVAAAAGDHRGKRRAVDSAEGLLAAKGVTASLDHRITPATSASHVAEAAADRFTNAAWQTVRACLQASADGDTARVSSLFHEEVRHASRAPRDDHVGVDREVSSSAADHILSVGGSGGGHFEAAAIRGDDLCLARVDVDADGIRKSRWLVAHVVDGLIGSLVWFEEDQLTDAFAELDRRHFESLGFAPGHWLVEAWPGVYSTGGDAVAPSLHPDVEYTEHRRFIQRTGGAHDLLDSADANADGRAIVPRVFRLTEEGTVFERVEIEAGAPGELRMILVLGFAEEHIRRFDAFDPEDLDAALALFDRDGFDSPNSLVPSPASQDVPDRRFTNTAWEISLLADKAFALKDPTTLLLHLSPDFVSVWHERLAGGRVEIEREAFVDVVLHVDGSARRIDRATELLAVRGDRLALTLNRTDHDGTVHVRYAVVESDDHQLIRYDWFDDDGLDAAVDELDRRWLAGCGVPPEAFVVAVWPRANTLQADDLSDIVHPDFEFTDHRSLRHDTDGVSYDEFARRAWVEADTWTLVTEVHRFDESGTVHTRVERNGDDEIWIVFVAEQADGALRRLDLFDADDLDTALALFDGCTGNPKLPDRSGPPTNRAFRIADEFGRAVIDGDREAILSLLSDDFETDDQRPIRSALGLETRVHGAEFADLMLTTAAQEAAAALTRILVACRGDDLYVATSTMTTADGDELLTHVLGESDGSRLRRVTFYDQSQLADAIDDLDRRYRLSCGIDDNHWIARRWRSLTSPDADVYDEILAADYRSVEHRAVHLGVTDRDVFIAYLRATPTSTSWSVPAIHRLSDRGMVLEQLETWADGTGDTRMMVVVEFGHGVILRMDAYEPDDHAAAIARYDEITGESRPTLTNAAWESTRRRQHAQGNVDHEGYASMIDESFVAEFHDLLMSAMPGAAIFDRTAFLELILHQDMTHDGATSEMELIAVRGEDLCLYLVGMTNASGDLTQRLVVDATRDGRCTRMDIFEPDQLTDAIAELDRGYRLSCGIGDDHWIAENWAVLYATDFADLHAVLHPQFEYVERRRLGWPNGDADDWREWLTPNTSAQETMIPAMYRLCEHGVVTRRSERFEAGDLGVSESILVNEVADGRVRRVVSYQPDDLDRALAEFDAFVAAPAPSRALKNASWELVQRAELIRCNGDRDGCASLLSDDLVVIAHDPIMAAIDDDRGAYDKEHYLDALLDPTISGPKGVTDQELVAVRGDDRCLVRITVTTAEGDLYERLNMVEVHDGLCVRIDVFPHDQLGEAQITLDHSWLTSLGFADDHPWFGVLEWFYANDPTLTASELPGRYHYVDHRRLTYPSGDRNQLIANMNTRIGSTDFVVPRYLRVTDRIALVEHYEQPTGGFERSGGLMLSRLGPGGRVEYMEVFDFDAEGAAIAAFDRLLAEERAEEPELGPLTNAAWDVVGAVSELDGVAGHHELIAVRADRFCLTRFIGTDAEGRPVDRLVVSDVVDGLVERSITFGADDLVAALLELDDEYAADIDEPTFLNWTRRMAEAFRHGSFEDLRALVTDDFQSNDHRALGLVPRNADEWAASIVPLVGHHRPVTTRIVRHDGPLWLSEVRPQFLLDGTEWHMLVLVRRVGHRISCWEVFDLEQLGHALSRYDELTSETRSAPELTNRASEITSAFNAAYLSRDRVAIDRLVDQDGPVDYRLRLRVIESDTARNFVDLVLASHADAMANRQQLEIVAVRGEHLCLVLVDGWYDDDNLQYCLVVETDDERITQMVWFDDDQLIDAQLELDRRWLASTDLSGHWFEPHWPLLYDPHPDAMFDFLTPDFEYVDHRPLMFPSGDSELLRSTIASMEHEAVFTIPRIHRMSDAGGVFERLETAIGDVGETHVVFVNRFVDQRVRSIEAFDITQLDQALARYEEFTSD